MFRAAGNMGGFLAFRGLQDQRRSAISKAGPGVTSISASQLVATAADPENPIHRNSGIYLKS